jgi:holliday junction DNA helicase RuvA
MIDAVYGTILSSREQTLIIHTAAVDFELQVSQLTAAYFARLPREEREYCKVLTILQHREDAMILYGFRSADERSLFQEIVKVQGIGAKQALKILSSISPADFVQALDTGNLAVLTSVPGLGTKTAQKMILALRNRLTASDDGRTSGTGVQKQAAARTRQMVSDIIQSLSDMGYDKRDVRRIVEETAEEFASSGEPLEVLEKKLFTQSLLRLG